MTAPLADLLAQCAPSDLLPARRATEAGAMRTPLQLLAHARLSERAWYLLVRDARDEVYGVPAVVSQGRLRRAEAGDGAAEDLVRLLQGPLAPPLSAEVFHLGEVPPAGAAAGELAVPVDQTNELVTVGEVAMVKWLLHPRAGEQPGAVRARQLQDVEDVPRTWALVHADVQDDRVLIATVVEAIPHAQDGWDWAVDDVRAVARGDVDRTNPLQLGALVARVHAALARSGTGQATEADAVAWHAGAVRDAELADLAPAIAEQVHAALAPLATCAGTPVTSIHGDLHIGQVLRAGDTGPLRLIDFDGNPLLSASENLALQPAARDVAAMLASLDHVGRVVLHRTEDLTATERERVHAWIGRARTSFLDGYRAQLDDLGYGDLLDEALLHPMLVQQECREYVYAQRYLPHWRYVPDAALPDLLLERPDAR